MTEFDWRTVDLDKGVLREPTPDENRIILWLPEKVEAGFQHWERITNVPGAEIVQEQGICFTEATSMPAQQQARGFFGRLFHKLRKPAENPGWLLPTGDFAEQAGQRRTGLLLVWSEAETVALDEARLKERWTGEGQLRKVGKNLFVVNPVQPGFSAAVPALLGNPREQAEELLAAARQAGDRGAEASALTDLGIAFMRGGDSQRALVILEEAVASARQLGDRSRENDALGHLATALVAADQPARAQELLGQTLAYAREAGDRFQEKITLANLGAVLASIHDFGEALVATDHALKLAREVGDRHHEADLLWFQAIQHAELGRQEQASALAQAAIDIHATLRSPHVGWLTSHLKKYRPIPVGAVPGASALGMASPGGYYTGPTAAGVPFPPSDPGVLRTAASAVKALEMSAGSGIKTAGPEVHQERLQTCAACPHHTGMRCKLCGHFTRAKAWLPHETCPIGKWIR